MSHHKMRPVVPFPITESPPSTFEMMNVGLDLMRLRVPLWEGARFLFADLPANASEVRKITPGMLRLQDPCRVRVFIANYPKTAFTGAYNEAAVLVYVKSLGGSGVYCPWMVVDDDTALIYGREVLGYPKKMAEIPFEESAVRITASVTRRGVRVASFSATRLEPEEKPAPVLGTKTFNVGGMGQFFAYNPIWGFAIHERVHESYRAEVELELEDSAYDPIKRLIGHVKGPVPARIATVDISGTKVMFPVGIAGLRVFTDSYNLRYR